MACQAASAGQSSLAYNPAERTAALISALRNDDDRFRLSDTHRTITYEALRTGA